MDSEFSGHHKKRKSLKVKEENDDNFYGENEDGDHKNFMDDMLQNFS
jgi:hypothetical protein